MKAGEVRRAKVILRLAAGESYRAIVKREGCSQDSVARWKERFVKERLAGLYARHRGKIVSEGIRRPMLSACTSSRRSTPQCSVSTKRVPSKRWIVWTRFCRFRPVGLNDTALNTIAMERSRSMQPLRPGAARPSARPAPATPVQSSSPFWRISPPVRLQNEPFTSSAIT